MSFSNCSEENLLYQPKYFTEWRSEVLYGLAKWKNGLAFKKINFSNNGKPVIKIAELKNGLSAQTKYTRDEFDKSVFLTKGDMVFSWSGNPETSIDIFWYNLPDGWLNQHIFKVTVDNGIDEKFFYYILKFLKPNFTAIASNKQTTGLGHVTIGDLKNIIVKLPELEEQKAIAHILATLDDKIEVNNQINKTLENMAQAIFKQWFVDFEFPNEDGQPYKSSGGEMVESELGMIPKGWEVKELGEIIDIHDSKRIPLSKNEREKREKIYPYYGAASLMDYVDEYIFDGIYVLLGEDGTVVNEDGSPVLQYVWGKFWVNNHAHVLSGKKGVSINYLYILLSNLNVSGAITGAVQLKINQKNLKELKIIMPNDMKLISQFSDIVDKSFEKIRVKRDESNNLVSLRDSLLPKLMSGEIRVPLDDEGDES
ncbi:restriction endonuclease subunit S [Enterococcus casseliflavus]|uniref:restriction endonuclease subunit S n=1 Tax=Enterococcus casseliflavus TaxID=37734 RepID=UPI003D6AE47B